MGCAARRAPRTGAGGQGQGGQYRRHRVDLREPRCSSGPVRISTPTRALSRPTASCCALLGWSWCSRRRSPENSNGQRTMIHPGPAGAILDGIAAHAFRRHADRRQQAALIANPNAAYWREGLSAARADRQMAGRPNLGVEIVGANSRESDGSGRNVLATAISTTRS